MIILINLIMLIIMCNQINNKIKKTFKMIQMKKIGVILKQQKLLNNNLKKNLNKIQINNKYKILILVIVMIKKQIQKKNNKDKNQNK